MADFLKVNDRRNVNLDQIVDLKFDPATDGIDYEDDPNGKPYHFDEELTLTLASLWAEIESRLRRRLSWHGICI